MLSQLINKVCSRGRRLTSRIISPIIRTRLFIHYRKQYKLFATLDTTNRFSMSWQERYPCLDDATDNTPFEPHYLYHPAWAARIIAETKPRKHTDISSIVNFNAVVSAFIPVDFYDYRPASINLDNLKTAAIDLTNIAFASNSIPSLSCMHTVEHVGLGRYGDPLDPIGDIKAFNELNRVCAIDGNLLLVVPVGRPRIQFNAHRIYSPSQVLEHFTNFELKDFSIVLDDASYHKNASLDLAINQNFGCGCFWLKKISAMFNATETKFTPINHN